MIFDLIKKRRSIFPVQYNDKPIAKEDLGIFLSTKYQEVEDKPKQVKIKKLMDNPAKSAAVIAICMQRDSNDCVPEWEKVQQLLWPYRICGYAVLNWV